MFSLLTFFKSLDEVFCIGSRPGYSKQALSFDAYTLTLRKAKVYYHKTVDKKHANVLMCSIRGHTISLYGLTTAAHNKRNLTARCLATEDKENKHISNKVTPPSVFSAYSILTMM